MGVSMADNNLSYTKTFNFWLDREDITRSELCALIAINSFYGKKISYSQIARRGKMGHRSAVRAVKTLIEKKLIKIKYKGKGSACNIYEVILPGSSSVTMAQPEKEMCHGDITVVPPWHRGSATMAQPVVSPWHTNKIKDSYKDYNKGFSKKDPLKLGDIMASIINENQD